MNRFKFGGLETKGLYIDETVMRMCYTHRRLFGRLLIKLLDEGKKDKAAKCMAYLEKKMPTYNVPMTFIVGGAEYLEAYYRLGQKAKAEKTFKDMFNNSVQYMKWYCSLDGNRFFQSQRDCMYHLYAMQSLLGVCARYDEKFAMNNYATFQKVTEFYQSRGGRMLSE